MAVEKFLGGVSHFQKHVYPKHQDLFEKLALGQRPEALFITCADSRIDPCMVTQTKPGELFICRVIGNIVPPYPDAIGGVSATIEYAVGVLEVPVVIVCGHTDCGVMKGALNPEALTEYPNVTFWLRYAKVEHQDLLTLTERSVVAQLANLRTHPTVAARVADGSLALHGWVYHIGSGTVTAYDPEGDRFAASRSDGGPARGLIESWSHEEVIARDCHERLCLRGRVAHRRAGARRIFSAEAQQDQRGDAGTCGRGPSGRRFGTDRAQRQYRLPRKLGRVEARFHRAHVLDDQGRHRRRRDDPL